MKALLLLGCPEISSQTPMAMYTCSKLIDLGYEVTISANPAAAKLVKVSDPKGYYKHKNVNIDNYLDKVQDEDYDLIIGFVHKDSAATYFITYCTLMKNTKKLALVFNRDQSLVDELAEMVDESTDAYIATARAYHNPNPIKVSLNKALDEILNNQ
ncbi:DUF1890 domain-containing protein [Methanobrevibacter wolinii]|uniref:DUF1890 domain-containing protein n=1 Tax=Methanobrevibacter wolinii TaxID=190977 RepID=UPI0005B2D56A|nr:DUF1890 domain-containing protein [Methanobrevibacter wolinii]MDD5959291.1 DUF1890 domain-containing protein [Methanobrevibacter wolinii]